MRDSVAAIRRVSNLAQVCLLAGVYFAVAKLSLLFAIPPGYATAVWPPSGIALAAALLFGNRIWPGIWIGAALVNYTVNSSLFAAVMIGTGNTLEAIAGATLFQYLIGIPYRFERGEDVVKFAALAALSPTIAATVALLPLAFANSLSWRELFWNWLTWWQGDATGIIIVTPLVLSWCIRDPAAWTPTKRLEAIAFGVLLLTAAAVVFGNVATPLAPFARAFVILPFIIWAAFRFSPREVTTVTAALCAVAVRDTVAGLDSTASASLNEALLLLLAFISTLVITGLVLSAVVGERSRAMDRLQEALHDLRAQAVTDPLTNLLNRRYLGEFLPRELIRARRQGDSLAVVMIDLDHFKEINDRFGHDAGDLVLTQVAALLKTHIRGSDIACRYGGEEFALVLPDTTLEGARGRAENIRGAIKNLDLSRDGRPIERFSASFGIALFPHHGADADALIRASDDALYEAKRAGRDRVTVSSATHGAGAQA